MEVTITVCTADCDSSKQSVWPLGSVNSLEGTKTLFSHVKKGYGVDYVTRKLSLSDFDHNDPRIEAAEITNKLEENRRWFEKRSVVTPEDDNEQCLANLENLGALISA